MLSCHHLLIYHYFYYYDYYHYFFRRPCHYFHNFVFKLEHFPHKDSCRFPKWISPRIDTDTDQLKVYSNKNYSLAPEAGMI